MVGVGCEVGVCPFSETGIGDGVSAGIFVGTMVGDGNNVAFSTLSKGEVLRVLMGSGELHAVRLRSPTRLVMKSWINLPLIKSSSRHQRLSWFWRLYHRRLR